MKFVFIKFWRKINILIFLDDKQETKQQAKGKGKNRDKKKNANQD